MTRVAANPLESILEAILFVAPRPLGARWLADLTGRSEKEIRGALAGLSRRYLEVGSALEVREAGGKFQLVTRPEMAPHLAGVADRPRAVSLSAAAMETLAAVAFYGPITRAEIEAIRGVAGEGPLATLEERGLIREAGRKEAPGRPFLYTVTGEFFRRFGVKDLGELQKLGQAEKEEKQKTQLSFQKAE